MRSIFDAPAINPHLSYEELLGIIGSVRRRWRIKLALRGFAILLAVGIVTFLVATYGMDQLRFSATAVTVFRIVSWLAVAVVAAWFLVRPQLRRVSDAQVALYLEEHEPSLQGAVVSAVEFGEDRARGDALHSPLITRRLIESALEQCAAVDEGRRVDRTSLRRSSGFLAGATALGLVALVASPDFLRYGAPFLAPWNSPSGESPYAIGVTPGNTAVARGSDQRVSAVLRNFESAEVDVSVRRGPSAEWERWPMTINEIAGEYEVFLFGIDEPLEYLVEASGVRSASYRIDVLDLPYAERVDLEYHFPSYTGLEPQRQEGTGDIAALRGTRVIVEVTPTVPVSGGLLVVEDGDSLPMTLSEAGVLAATMTVGIEGFYHVEFPTPGGDLVVGSPEYIIDVLRDQPPAVSIRKPGRDTKATTIEEVFTEVQAEDDYGIGRVDLIFSVNGGPEDTLALYQGGRRRTDVQAGHTFFLEELPLEPGDFISYYARAQDRRTAGGTQESITDIYFLEIRPFDQEFRQADQQGPPGGGGGMGMDNALSYRQRLIVAATFKAVRDSTRFTDDEFAEVMATLALSQGKLREQVENLVRRINNRGMAGVDSTFAMIAELLPRAAEAMQDAEGLLGEQSPDSALAPEQRALQALQRAEAAFRETQVSQGGGGGGGGQAASAEDLADLFELEVDRLRNQYEQLQRGQREQADAELDATLQKLQELARRQQQETERRRAQPNSQRGQGGGSANQRQLAEQAEELARQLERLAREESRPDLQQTARDLQEIADEMRRAANSSRDGAISRGNEAIDRLRDAQRRLEQSRTNRLEEAVQEALNRARRLERQQRDLEDDVQDLPETGSERLEQLQEIVERKDQMADEVSGLESELDRLARDSRRDQRDASRKLQEAATSIRNNRLEDKIRYTRGVVAQRSPEFARNLEGQIGNDLEELRERIEEAAGAVGESPEQRIARSLDQARDVVRGLESLQDRIQERAEDAGSDQQQDGQQQGQQQGGQAQGGQPQEGLRGGNPNGGQARLAPRDARQFGREFGERRGELEDLRDALGQEGFDVGDLEAAIERLRRLERGSAREDIRGLAQLQAAVIQSLKEFEYALRRQLDGTGRERLFLSGSDHVPAGFRELVEEYYKALSDSASGNRD